MTAEQGVNHILQRLPDGSVDWSPVHPTILEALRFISREIDRVEASIGNKVERIDPATMGYPVKQE